MFNRERPEKIVLRSILVPKTEPGFRKNGAKFLMQLKNSEIVPRLFLWLFLANAVFFLTCSNSVGKTPIGTIVTPKYLTADQILMRTRSVMGTLESFQFHLKHKLGSTVLPGGFVVNNAVGAVNTPDRVKLSADTVFGGVFIKIDAVVLPDITYMTNPLTGNWNLIKPDESPFAVFDPAGLISDILAKVQSNRFANDEPYRGGLYILAGELPGEAFQSLVGEVGPGKLIDYEMFIDPVDFYMTAVRLNGPLNSSEERDIDRTIEFSDFDEIATIQPPI